MWQVQAGLAARVPVALHPGAVASTATLPGCGLSDVLWSDPALVEHGSTWRCRECVEDDRWGVCSLAESMLTFSSTQCSAKSAAYSVLTYFHAGTTQPEVCFLHAVVSLREPIRMAVSKMWAWWMLCGAGRIEGWRRVVTRTRRCLASWISRP